MATTTEWVKGLPVTVVRFTLTYADTDAAIMVTLPENAIIVDYVFNVKTAFSGGTTQANLGTSSTATELVSGLSVASKGIARPTTEVALPGHKTTALTNVYGKVGASNTVGEVEVALLVVSPLVRRR